MTVHIKSKPNDARSHLLSDSYGYAPYQRELLIKAFDSLLNNQRPYSFSNINPPKGFPTKTGTMTFDLHRVVDDKVETYHSSLVWDVKKKQWTNFKLNRFQ